MRIRTVDNNVGFRVFNQNAENGAAITEVYLEATDSVSFVCPQGYELKYLATTDVGEQRFGLVPVEVQK